MTTQTATHAVAFVTFDRCGARRECTCGKVYVHESGIQSHIRRENSVATTDDHGIASISFERSKCDCGKTYARETGLLGHIRSETGLSFAEIRAARS